MIAGICKVWNEEEVIAETLAVNGQFCDQIYVYDDCSTDGTLDILNSNPQVQVERGLERHPNRHHAQGGTLQLILEVAMRDNPDWIIQFDADEHLVMPEGDWQSFDGVRMKLYDFYITPADEHLHYTQRSWLGPEFRPILMAYRPFPGMAYGWRDQREMWGIPTTHRILNAGYVKHYGKAVSVKRWERQCDYYATHFPEPYKTKWENRRGKAVHTDYKSDFGRPLINWDQRDRLGVVLL